MKAQYNHYICEVTDLRDTPESKGVLTQISEKGEEIVSCFYLTDSNQVVIIVKGQNPTFLIRKLLDEQA